MRYFENHDFVWDDFMLMVNPPITQILRDFRHHFNVSTYGPVVPDHYSMFSWMSINTFGSNKIEHRPILIKFQWKCPISFP